MKWLSRRMRHLFQRLHCVPDLTCYANCFQSSGEALRLSRSLWVASRRFMSSHAVSPAIWGKWSGACSTDSVAALIPKCCRSLGEVCELQYHGSQLLPHDRVADGLTTWQELLVLTRRLDTTRGGDLLSLGVSPPEDNSWRAMFIRLECSGDVETEASFFF